MEGFALLVMVYAWFYALVDMVYFSRKNEWLNTFFAATLCFSAAVAIGF